MRGRPSPHRYARGAPTAEAATLEAPYIPARLADWAERVYARYRAVTA
jgi:hypothetical protein